MEMAGTYVPQLVGMPMYEMGQHENYPRELDAVRVPAELDAREAATGVSREI